MEREQRADHPVRLLTVTEVAAALRVSKRTAYALVRSGEIPSLRVGTRGVRVLEPDLERYVQAARERQGR
jgi:excisionase family DNA binding protein